MNGPQRFRFIRSSFFLAVLQFSVVRAMANPIPISQRKEPLSALMAFAPIVLAILLEAICVSLILQRSRHPRLFILWLLGMHLLTYPLFLGLLWLLQGVHPALAMALGEAAIVLIEGGLIYLMCRFISPSRSVLSAPSISKSLFASLMGNICSAVTFPFLLLVYRRIVYAMMSSNVE